VRKRLVSLLATAVLVAAACSTATPSASPSPGPTQVPTSTPTAITPTAIAPTPAPTKYPADVKYVITVKLKAGIKWSDGTDLKAADWVGTYDVYWAQQDPSWASLVNVVALDDQTFQFWLKDLSQQELWYLVRWNQAGATSQFGDFFKLAHDLRVAGKALDSPEVKKLNDDLNAFKPTNAVTDGPFQFDPASITVAQMELVKNPGGFNADKIGFDKLIVYWGDSQQAVPLILSNQLDYTTSALSPADERAAVADSHLKIIRGPLGVGPAIWFNENIKPFDKKEFRQAVAYLIDRAQVGTVSLGQSAHPIVNMAGFSDELADQWLTPDTKAKLNHYDHDTAKAEQLLTGIGWKKVGSNWQDETGKTVSYELTVSSDFVDFLASGQEVAQELTSFGIKTTVRGIASADRPATIKGAKYQMLIDFNQISTPAHPAASMKYYMTEGFFGSNSPDAAAGEPKGYNWPLTQTAPDGSTVKIRDLLAQSEAGLDVNAQKVPVQTLALIFNDQLPIVPLYERFTNEPINVVDRVDGWLDFSDPVYLNNQGTDNYASQQLVGGILKVSAGGDKTFRTNAPYSQPPNYSLNFFNYTTGLMWTITSPTYDALYPPLFWGSVKDGTYINTGVGDSWVLQQVNG
jgi:peptide/nickel transport system substrate-binding protein